MRLIKKFKYPLTLIIVLLIIISLLYLKRKLNHKKYDIVLEDETIIEKSEEETNEIVKEEKCFVDIKGAVKNPGLYESNCDKRVNDIIALAGGLTEDANTSVINLSKKISDEMVIIIYTNEEVKNSNVVNTVIKVIDKECNCPNIENDGCINTEINSEITNNQNSGLINLNEATEEELMSLPGIGESKAKAIIEYRSQEGKFNSIDEILNVSGIGESLYEQIKIYITT